MDTQDAIKIVSEQLQDMAGHVFDVLTIEKPVTVDAAVNLSKIVSKLSPILGNLIEFNTVEFLNNIDEFKGIGHWIRQDPGFPDTLFVGDIDPAPGFEIKAWFPFATEITARFRDSQSHFANDETYVAMLAWLPQHLIYGKPHILGVGVFSALSIAQARDLHYHQPPDYLVIEPNDTTARTRNLQQTNTAGYKFQGTPEQFAEAVKIVESWGDGGKNYSPAPEYQVRLNELMGKYLYRLDTNYAKMDRIAHKGVEHFKQRVCALKIHDLTVNAWSKILSSTDSAPLRKELAEHFTIGAVDVEQALLEDD